MNLYEYQAKRLFSKFNLPILENRVYSNVSEIKNNMLNITKHGFPWIAKCQIHAGGRGKSGGIRIIYSEKDIYLFFDQWLDKKLVTYQTIKTGETVKYILLEPLVKTTNEFYISICIDRNQCQIICIASNKGGVNIENVLEEKRDESSNLIHKMIVDPFQGPYPYQGRILAYKLGLTGIHMLKFVTFYINMVHMFLKKDLTLVEINPLVFDKNQNLLCLDAKVIIDDNALFRQSELLNLCSENNDKIDNQKNNSSDDILSYSDNNEFGINYVALDGNIGCMVNGAGLAMATMDLIKSLGGNPANFLDIGGDTNKDCIISSLKALLKIKRIKAIFINIFGGIVCCNLVADSIISAVSKSITGIIVPIVVRLEGNNADTGSLKLINSNLNIVVINDLVNAIQKVITLVK